MAVGNGVANGASDVGDLKPGSKLWITVGHYAKLVGAVIVGTALTVGTFYATMSRVAANEAAVAVVAKDVVDVKADVAETKKLVMSHDRAIVKLQEQVARDNELKELLRAVLAQKTSAK